MSSIDAPIRRHRRALIAQRLIARAPTEAATLDWDALDQAPDWLGLPEQEFAALQCRVGAVLHAPTMRLWIDGARIAAARAALGERFLQRLLAESAGLAMPRALLPRALTSGQRIDSAAHVGLALASAGASVLLATLDQGPLQRAASVALAPIEPAEMLPALAQSTVTRAQSLGEIAR